MQYDKAVLCKDASTLRTGGFAEEDLLFVGGFSSYRLLRNERFKDWMSKCGKKYSRRFIYFHALRFQRCGCMGLSASVPVDEAIPTYGLRFVDSTPFQKECMCLRQPVCERNDYYGTIPKRLFFFV